MYEHEMDLWWYRVRRKLVQSLLERYGRGSKRILDVGCGTGGLLLSLRGRGELYGVDISKQAIEYCLSRGLSNLKVGSAELLPYDSNFFDVVISLDVIEHVKDDRKAVAEIFRVLRPGGTAIIFVPAFMMLWGVTDVISHHYRRYVKGTLLPLFIEQGFHIIRYSYFNFFLFLPILAVRWSARIFRINMKTENRMARGAVNTLLFNIFSLEILCLKYLSFPLGVSLLVIAKKPM